MKLSDFHRFILPEVVGCPEPMVDQAILQTVYEFCDQSGAWDEFQDPQTIQADVVDYDLDPPAGGIVLRVREVWINDRLLEFSPTWEVAHWGNQKGDPIRYNAAVDRSQIRVFPAPNATGGQLKVRAVYAPSLSATTLPDFLIQRYAEGIASGVKAKLMLMSGAVWSSPQLGAYYRDVFTSSMVNARIESMHERVEGSLRVRHRPFHVSR